MSDSPSSAPRQATLPCQVVQNEAREVVLLVAVEVAPTTMAPVNRVIIEPVRGGIRLRMREGLTEMLPAHVERWLDTAPKVSVILMLNGQDIAAGYTAYIDRPA